VRRDSIAVVAVAACGCGSHPATTQKQAARKLRGLAVTIVAPTHAPRVGRRWRYVVRARDRHGRAVRGRLTVQVVDPIGQRHAVQYANTKRNIVNWPFSGRFSDFIAWPLTARRYRLVLVAAVRAGAGAGEARFEVRPR
jgi:hypothetical protein